LACERYGKFDVLVNNAGIAPTSLLDELRVENWEEMIDVNIKGVLYGIAAALPVFRKEGSGISLTPLLLLDLSRSQPCRFIPALSSPLNNRSMLMWAR